jgi:hypothetical protein
MADTKSVTKPAGSKPGEPGKPAAKAAGHAANGAAKSAAKKAADPSEPLFFGRDESWMLFNQRVLEEAEDTSNPLLERVKFLAITASNLDEFIEIRVAGLRMGSTRRSLRMRAGVRRRSGSPCSTGFCTSSSRRSMRAGTTNCSRRCARRGFAC